VRVEPSASVHPVFGSWLERRRRRMRAQMDAIEDERFDALVALIEEEDQDRPPTPRGEHEEEAYRRMLADSESLTVRLAEIRGRLLGELRDVERRQGLAIPRETRSRRGGSLDGYI